MDDQFLGVYTTNEAAPAMGEFPRPGVRRKRWWFVWLTGNDRYKVQPLNAVLQPMAEPRVISSMEFESRYTQDEDCPAVPAGYARAGAEGEVTVNPQEETARAGVLAADDPHLLQRWMGVGSSAKGAASSMALPMELAQLMGDILPAAATSAGEDLPGSPAVAGTVSAPALSDAERAKRLRERFVQALLRLRRGERAESLADLHALLNEPHGFFEGGAQLFSEFGLGLRRLGFVHLALAAHKRALEFAPRDARILFNIARSCHDLDMVLEAKDFLDQALAVEPGFALARQFLAFLDAGSRRQEKSDVV